MGLVFRKTRKLRKSWKSRKQTRIRNRIQSNKRKLQRGGYPIIAATTTRMIIKYISESGDISKYIQLISGQMDVDMTKEYTQGKLNKEPQIEFQGLESGKRYLLTMTDPNALGKTWTHWVAEIISNSNGAGQISRPEIAEYAPPKPPNNSGVHHYIFRLYSLDMVEQLPRKLIGNERGTYFEKVLMPFINGKDVVLEAGYIIDKL